MMSIQSLGGPLLCLPLGLTHHWSANTGKRFIGDASEYANDYDASYLGIGQSLERPISIAVLRGASGDALVFPMPYETQMICSSRDMVCLGQVITSEDKDPLAAIGEAEINHTAYDEEVLFRCSEVTSFCVFDAALTIDEVGQDRLEFVLEAGPYSLSAGTCQTSGMIAILYRFLRQG